MPNCQWSVDVSSVHHLNTRSANADQTVNSNMLMLISISRYLHMTVNTFLQRLITAAESVLIIIADFWSVLQSAVPSLLSTSPHLHDSDLLFKATLLAYFFTTRVFLIFTWSVNTTKACSHETGEYRLRTENKPKPECLQSKNLISLRYAYRFCILM